MMLEKLSGSIIGAVIGYCTNYIAVKMLFYPRKEIKICGHKLPFTPGAIPKGKPRLAKAVGNIVAGTLLTKDDIKKKILSPETEQIVVGKMMDGLSTDIHTCVTKVCPSENDYRDIKEKLSNELTNQILDSVQRIDMKNTIVQEAERVIKEKTKGTMLEMFLTDELINSLIQPIGEEIVKYINDNGRKYIRTEVGVKIISLEQSSIIDICKEMNIDKDAVNGLVTSVYHMAVETAVENILGNLNIAGIIEDKINEMQVEELEKMVLSVMKKELDTIVNLGALVGGLLGILNMFF